MITYIKDGQFVGEDEHGPKVLGLFSRPTCKDPECALMHRGLSDGFIMFLCAACGAWHPIADHPTCQNHGAR